MATLCYYFLFCSLLVSSAITLNLTSLSGEWLVEDETGNYNLTGTVPGGIYTDLMNAKIIGDVFFGQNDTETRWVARSNWTYSRQILVDEIFLGHSSINLVFEGLDTFASVLVNGVLVGRSENMFVRYIFDVKNTLQVGNNTIEVEFTSPIKMAESLASKQGYIVPPECPSGVYNGECHVNQIRKMQASFSWDWGPALPSMGIWKEVYLEAFNSSVIRYIIFEYEDAPDDDWLIQVTSILQAQRGQTIVGKIVYELETDVALIQEIVDVNQTNDKDVEELEINFSFLIPKISVRKWWPNGYGAQQLYNLTATFQNNSETSSKSAKIGFRKIELVQTSIGSGLSFYFKVNGVPIFAKGANQIPIDILPEKGQNPKQISKILESAFATNMNMLRVWGGGVYESDYFYERTDELGILIWQDFMFACAMYPAYTEYLENVKTEVRHQIKRLRSHPSIALWAGNNENELALMTNWYGTQNNLTLYKNDYIKLYVETIRSEVYTNLTKTLIFLTSSPSNGKESESEGYLAQNPGSPLFGDVHFYNYLTNSLDPKTYPTPRFASEYGYQSLPSVDTWLTATNDVADLNPDSPFMNHRQHHPLGLIENTLLISYQLHLNSSVQDYYEVYIFYSQIVQALSIKFETEYYRSFMGRVDEQGQGSTMGALFWQLNDVWVAPTWAGIDYSGKWKMLQYYALDFFATTIITAYLDTSRQLHVFAMSEIPSLFESSLEVTAAISVYKWASFQPLNSTLINITLEFGKSVEVTVLDTDTFLHSIGCGSLLEAKSNCFFHLNILSGNAVVSPNNWIAPAALKDSNLTKTSVNISSITQLDKDGRKFEIQLEADGISLFVWLDSHRVLGRFGENGFLQVAPLKNVTFVSEDATSVLVLQSVVTVRHLNNLQYQ